MSIRLDLSKPYGTISGKTDNGARYIQDGLEFGSDRQLLGDEKAILKERSEKELAVKQQELDELLKSAAKLEEALGGDSEEAKVEVEAPKSDVFKEEVEPEVIEKLKSEAPKSKPPKSKPSKA